MLPVQATDHPNTEQPIQEKNASATTDPRADELINNIKKTQHST